MNYKKTNDIEKMAMKILLHAGDGRQLVLDALDLIAEFKFVEAEENIKKAFGKIKKAHEYQTTVIQSVASQTAEEQYSMLFTHAQDTLMVIYSEYNVSLKILNIQRKFYEKVLLLIGAK